MKQPVYLSLILSFFLLSFGAKAQGPSVDLQGVSIGPSNSTPIAINQIQTVQVVVKNNGPDAIPIGEALLTVTINSTILRFDTPLAFSDPTGTFTITSSSLNTLQIANTAKALPANPAGGFILEFNVRGNATGSGALNLASTLSPTATSSDRDGNNQSASGSITVTAAMPVALVSFTAKALEDRTVGLNWTTSLETNNKGFVIERSKDLKLFEKVGEVTEVAPASNALKNYSLVDRTPYSGTSYYRLTQMDLDGKATAYPVVSVVLRDEAYGVFPNPVVRDGRFSLRLDEPETATINFFSADGRPLPFQKTGIQSGNLLLKSTSNLSAGVYVLTVEERGQTRQHRLVVE